MKRLAVDMDGVLADVYAQFYSMHKRDTGKEITPEEVIGKLEFDAFEKAAEHVVSDGFFLNAPVMKDSQEILAQLNKQYEIYIVSSAMEFPKSLSEKYEWLTTHFPFISWKQIVFCGSKEIIKADIMIDDHFKNLDRFTGGTTLLYTQPHNALSHSGKHIRIDSWQEIAAQLI